MTLICVFLPPTIFLVILISPSHDLDIVMVSGSADPETTDYENKQDITGYIT